MPECSYFTFIGRLRRECWRFVTYIFVHLDHWHMIFNMLMQIIVGIPLEMSHGTIRVALLYLSGVFAASLTFSLAEPGLNLAGNYGLKMILQNQLHYIIMIHSIVMTFSIVVPNFMPNIYK